jgi:hypothetical protein
MTYLSHFAETLSLCMDLLFSEWHFHSTSRDVLYNNPLSSWISSPGVEPLSVSELGLELGTPGVEILLYEWEQSGGRVFLMGSLLLCTRVNQKAEELG